MKYPGQIHILEPVGVVQSAFKIEEYIENVNKVFLGAFFLILRRHFVPDQFDIRKKNFNLKNVGI